MYPHLNMHNSSTRSHPLEEENPTKNLSKNCKCKLAFKQVCILLCIFKMVQLTQVNLVNVLFTKYRIRNPRVFVCIVNGHKICMKSATLLMRCEPMSWLLQHVVAKRLVASHDCKTTTEEVSTKQKWNKLAGTRQRRQSLFFVQCYYRGNINFIYTG